MDTKLNQFDISALGSFLKGTPKLKTLQIKSSLEFVTDHNEYSNVEFGEYENLAFIPQLERVEIELVNGVAELELAKFLLKQAKELKKMIIFYSSSLPTDVIQEVNQFKMQASSSNIVWVLKVK
ncbi:hypothetical protein COLO4_29802 [Corchorus olitorius]|uniref:Uncharacterized protein n=1 Tax=Corchorus olitorius TaxID=93759 RepID=A0A1R3HD43_9ROSI|nr:hypothetical protein COLO4_29802 [Corchorus olitorius]